MFTALLKKLFGYRSIDEMFADDMKMKAEKQVLHFRCRVLLSKNNILRGKGGHYIIQKWKLN